MPTMSGSPSDLGYCRGTHAETKASLLKAKPSPNANNSKRPPLTRGHSSDIKVRVLLVLKLRRLNHKTTWPNPWYGITYCHPCLYSFGLLVFLSPPSPVKKNMLCSHQIRSLRTLLS